MRLAADTQVDAIEIDLSGRAIWRIADGHVARIGHEAVLARNAGEGVAPGGVGAGSACSGGRELLQCLRKFFTV